MLAPEAKRRLVTLFEWTGSALAILFALLNASNTGNEVLGFTLLFVSAALFAGWAVIDGRWAFLVLQVFYMGAAIYGVVRWS